MKKLIILPLLLLSMVAFGQTKSTHYLSKSRGHFTHGGRVTGTNTSNQSINIWTEGHEQGSSYAVNRVFIGNDSDTGVVSAPVWNLEQFNVLTYPNPLSDELTIEVVGNQRPITNVQLYDMMGREVTFTANDETNTSLNVAPLPSGSYVLKVTIGNSELRRVLIKP